MIDHLASAEVRFSSWTAPAPADRGLQAADAEPPRWSRRRALAAIVCVSIGLWAAIVGLVLAL